jgi:predicted house-cleaning noncanonical NTP pyrophosphatase (MazG superfamily)
MNTSTGKLVRDAIPQIIEAQGITPVVRVADREEYRQLLLAKLREETDEVDGALNAPADRFDTAEVVNELADVMEVLLAIAAELGIDHEHIEQTRITKAEERGGFAARIVWSGNQTGPGRSTNRSVL